MSPQVVQVLLCVTLLTIPLSSTLAGDPIPPEESLVGAFPATDTYSPYAGRDFPNRPLWGDTHLHRYGVRYSSTLLEQPDRSVFFFLAVTVFGALTKSLSDNYPLW